MIQAKTCFGFHAENNLVCNFCPMSRKCKSVAQSCGDAVMLSITENLVEEVGEAIYKEHMKGKNEHEMKNVLEQVEKIDGVEGARELLLVWVGDVAPRLEHLRKKEKV